MLCLLTLNFVFILNVSKLAYTFFEFSKSTYFTGETEFKISSGLLNKNEFVASKDSIFKIEIFPNAFMRGWSSARIVSFEGGEKGFIPSLSQKQLDDILLWLGLDRFNVSKAIRPHFTATLLFALKSTFKALFFIFIIFLIIGEEQHALFRNTFALCYIATFIFLLSFFKYRRGGVFAGENSIVIRDSDYFSGWSVINKKI